jgi:hypothetical protein
MYEKSAPHSGPNPTTSSCNVIFYNAAGSLARFENKNILFYFEERSSLLQRWLEVVGYFFLTRSFQNYHVNGLLK